MKNDYCKTNFNKDDFRVSPIDKEQTKDWFLHKHYARRMPSTSYAFGLFQKGILVGVISYGAPFYTVKKILSDPDKYRMLELNRLCTNDNLPINADSFFIGETFKMLPHPCVLVSYADSGHNHHGYIYQATNWIYTGLSAEFNDYMVKGYEHMNGNSILDMVGRSDNSSEGHLDKVKLLKEMFGEENVYMLPRSRKYRYVYFLGDKRQRRDMNRMLLYKSQPYPKGDNIRYDASYKPNIQLSLF